jgi:hypothetical protein
VIHIGFDALSGDLVEKRRYDRIMSRVNAFHPGRSRLEYIYCHYFAPETTPDEPWAIDETVHWISNHRRQSSRPLRDVMLVLPKMKRLPGRAHIGTDSGNALKYAP